MTMRTGFAPASQGGHNVPVLECHGRVTRINPAGRVPHAAGGSEATHTAPTPVREHSLAHDLGLRYRAELS